MVGGLWNKLHHNEDFLPLKDLEESHDKVIEIVTEATEKSIASCTRRLAAFKAP